MPRTMAEKCHLNIFLLAKHSFSEVEKGEKVKHDCLLLPPKLPFLDIYEFVFSISIFLMRGPMSGKNRQLVTNEPIEFEV